MKVPGLPSEPTPDEALARYNRDAVRRQFQSNRPNEPWSYGDMDLSKPVRPGTKTWPYGNTITERPSESNLLMAAAIMDEHGKLKPPPPIPQDPQQIFDQNRMQNLMLNALSRQPKR